MSTPEPDVMHDLRAARALIDRALKALQGTVQREPVHPLSSRAKVPPTLGSATRTPNPEPTDG